MAIQYWCEILSIAETLKVIFGEEIELNGQPRSDWLSRESCPVSTSELNVAADRGHALVATCGGRIFRALSAMLSTRNSVHISTAAGSSVICLHEGRKWSRGGIT